MKLKEFGIKKDDFVPGKQDYSKLATDDEIETFAKELLGVMD